MTKPTFPEYIQSVQEITTKSGRVLESVSESAGRAIIESLTHGGKVICFGNGGSADQASHLAGELVGRFRANRKSLPAISLVSDAATIALTGAGGLIGGKADYLVAVPSTDTAHIQEVHLMLLHVWCMAIDEAFA